MRQEKRNFMAFELFKILIQSAIDKSTKVSNPTIQKKLAELSFELTHSFIKASNTKK